MLLRTFFSSRALLKFLWPLLPANLKEKVRKRTMEVTAANFEAVLPKVEKALDEAEFVAIDGEFTGLNDNNR